MASQVTPKFKIAIAIVIAVVLAGAAGFWWMQPGDLQARQKEVKRLFLRGEYQRAQQLADKLLEWDASLDSTRMLAARSAARNNDVLSALAYLKPLTSQDGPLAVKAVLLEANLAAGSLFDFSRAESAYRQVLSISPDNVPALEGLVRLLATCGRRRDAIPGLLRLSRLGESSDLLTIAARGSGAIDNLELLKQARQAFPNDSASLVGLAMHADRADNFATAVDFSREAADNDSEFPAAYVCLGECLLSAGRFDELKAWENGLSEDTLAYAETWRVRGYLAEHGGKLQLALTYFLRAVQLGPDLKDVHFRFSQLLRRAGDETMADQFAERLKQIQQLEALQDRMFQSGTNDTASVAAMISAFGNVGRLWEAFGWVQVGLTAQPGDSTLLDLAVELAEQTKGLPLQLQAPSYDLARNLAPSDYSLVDSSPSEAPRGTAETQFATAVSFRNDAKAAGLKFDFLPGVIGPTTHRMFEFTGGGIAVCDFDLDDFPDVYCSQGGPWETRGRSDDATDCLFRNIRGIKYTDIATNAAVVDSQFGQGVAAGDVDGDGFPDVFVSGIGLNQLWLNNGDGTFANSPLPPSSAVDEWTTSAMIADINNDGAADIYAVNYLTGDNVFNRVCTGSSGETISCVPTHFNPIPDILYIGNADGTFIDLSAKLADINAGKGLGVAAFSPAGDGQLAILVSNDTTPNMLWSIDSDGRISDNGFASGLAVNRRGKAEGCMGIAVGDVNDDGLVELLVTNFYNETNTYYHGIDGGSFEDRTASTQLTEASLLQLGFGTQFLDADLDGQLELFVANGHVDDLQNTAIPYEMPSQFFRQRQGLFRLLLADELGDYFQTNHIGRSVVCLDWNVDGRTDLAIGHLHESYVLLTNTCADSGNGVSVRFVGVSSHRDAVGVTVSYQLDDRTITRQLTAGDGYFASNQREILLGCGRSKKIDALSVVWPSGHRQEFKDIPTGTRCVVQEHCGTVFLLP